MQTIENIEQMLKVEDDGVTHINVYTRGATSLGRDLSNLADIPVNHPIHGQFRTMEGLWFYLTTGATNEMFRVMNGWDARRLGKSMEKVWSNDFNTMVKIGLTAKILQNRELTLKLMTEHTDLNFYHYYYYGKAPNVKLVVPKGHDWQMKHLGRIRRMLMNTGRADALLEVSAYTS